MNCFISYSKTDSEIARSIHHSLVSLGVETFLAELTIIPGDDWTEEIWDNLRMSDCVIFLASKAACKSPFVQQELGGAKYDSKRIIPIVWDISPSDLPGWIDRSQALDLRGLSQFQTMEKFSSMVDELKSGDGISITTILGLAIAAVLIHLVVKDE